MGISRMSIQVFEQNTDAVRLYERLGYRRAETRPVLVASLPALL
jgi:ribosomal protein S18 acetylase RimI-like enzyme